MRTDDECYTGTGPAAEVACPLGLDTPWGTVIISVPKQKPGQAKAMTITGDSPDSGHWFSPEVVRGILAERVELLAQRDELASLLQRYLWLDEAGCIDSNAEDMIYHESKELLFRIKGA